MKTLQSFIKEDDTDFDEASESAVAKRKFLINRVMQKRRLPDESDDDKEEEKTEENDISVCDSRVLLISCMMPHKMNCSSHTPENNKKVICRSAYHKRFYAENRGRILARQKAMANRER